MKCLIGLIILVLLASEYSCEPCKDFKSVVCTRSMRLEVSAAKIYVYSLMTLDDCSDYYKEEYMTYDLYELCDSSDETECDDKNFETYNYKNCINLREGKDCSVKTEDDTLDDHKIQKHIFTIKGEDEFEMRVIFTTTEENFTKEFTLKDTSTSGMQGLPCQTDEITYTQEFK